MVQEDVGHIYEALVLDFYMIHSYNIHANLLLNIVVVPEWRNGSATDL